MNPTMPRRTGIRPVRTLFVLYPAGRGIRPVRTVFMLAGWHD
jgi:hypothetical protein